MKWFIMLRPVPEIRNVPWQNLFPVGLRLFYATVTKGLQRRAKVRMKPHASRRNFPAERLETA